VTKTCRLVGRSLHGASMEDFTGLRLLDLFWFASKHEQCLGGQEDKNHKHVWWGWRAG
jgi:hypothetical protein